MARRDTRARFRMDELESRQLLTSQSLSVLNPSAHVSVQEPTNEAQYMLELINEARTNPAAAANRAFADAGSGSLAATLNHFRVDAAAERRDIANAPARPPVAWSAVLTRAADSHSRDMADNRFQDHRGSDGSMPWNRVDRAGYANRLGEAENAFAYAETPRRAMQSFLIDWGVPGKGHRQNIQQSNISSPDENHQEVGIGIVRTADSKIGPFVVTQQFARRANATPQLLGVVYTDLDNDRFYTPGEGEQGARITARNLSTGETASTMSWASGGYQMPLKPGSYEVTATIRGRILSTRRLDMGNQNVKLDYELNALGANAASTTAPPSAPAAWSAPAPASSAPANTPASIPAQAVLNVSSTQGWNVDAPSNSNSNAAAPAPAAVSTRGGWASAGLNLPSSTVAEEVNPDSVRGFFDTLKTFSSSRVRSWSARWSG